jgi:hypothetical protein
MDPAGTAAFAARLWTTGAAAAARTRAAPQTKGLDLRSIKCTIARANIEGKPGSGALPRAWPLPRLTPDRSRDQSYTMWRGTLALIAALLLVAPSFARAQGYSDLDKQDPNEYDDQDSQLLNMVSYVLRPIGFTLEWGVARPLHYLATQSPLAPVLGANTDSDSDRLPPVTQLPLPDDIEESSTTHHDTVISSPYQAPVSSATPGLSAGSNQPALH